MPIIQGMNFRSGIYGLLLIFLLSLSSVLFAEERVHTVRAGDTIYSLSRFYNVTQAELLSLNGISDPSKIRVGQQLRIPDAPGTAASNNSGGYVFHKAVRGDTFFSLARTYETTVNDILRANSLASNYVLKEGDMLKIPVAAAAEPAISAPSPSIAARPDARATQTASVDTSIRWPINAKELNYIPGVMSGVIITGDRSESVKSLTSGTVISAGPHRGYGRVVIVQASNGYTYVYGGCETLTVKEGDKVGPGMEMGKLGVDAVTGIPQLFFRVYLNNTPIDPANAPRV